MTNAEIAKTLAEVSEYLEILNDSFRARAYARASGVIAGLQREANDIYAEGGTRSLEEIPSIGKGIAEKIEELLKEGSLSYLKELQKKLPMNVHELTAIEGVGPKTIGMLYRKLKVRTREDLERAARTGKLRTIPHFGEKTEKKILKSIEFLKKSRGRFLLGEILPIAQSIEQQLKNCSGITAITLAGSLRRMQETIGDIDIVASGKHPKKIIDAFTSLAEVEHIYSKGGTKANVRLRIGIDVDLRVVHSDEYGAALLYFTGDTQHNIELRKAAIKKGYTLSEYGLFRGKKRIASHTEKEIYAKLGFQWMPPEIRVASGELEAAQKRKLPNLISYGSIKGDLQVQTSWSDGTADITTMAQAAIEHGLEYIAISDHTQSLGVAGGLTEKELAKQEKEIEKLNEKFTRAKKNFRILKSAEINILKNGVFDISDAALQRLDVVSASIHSHFGMKEDEMTARIIKAMKHPRLNILFHPTGRLIAKREPYQVDILKVIKAAKEYGVALEVNAHPERLDLKDTHVRLAIEHGVKLVINSDAHAPDHFRHLDLGVAQVRRGWGEKTDILNTKSAKHFLKSLRSLKK